MYAFETQIRVRYGETDQMGYLYYGNYAEYYEVGRVFNENKKLINTGAVRLCFFDPATKKTCQAPEFLLEKLRPFFN